jgi:hypothetical protein
MDTEAAINVIFDGGPGAEGGHFVEVETDDGRSTNVGEWIERTDGLWALRISRSLHADLIRKAIDELEGGRIHDAANTLEMLLCACRYPEDGMIDQACPVHGDG